VENIYKPPFSRVTVDTYMNVCVCTSCFAVRRLLAPEFPSCPIAMRPSSAYHTQQLTIINDQKRSAMCYSSQCSYKKKFIISDLKWPSINQSINQ